MTEVKIENMMPLAGSNPTIYNQTSNNPSYSREGNFDDDYEE